MKNNYHLGTCRKSETSTQSQGAYWAGKLAMHPCQKGTGHRRIEQPRHRRTRTGVPGLKRKVWPHRRRLSFPGWGGARGRQCQGRGPKQPEICGDCVVQLYKGGTWKWKRRGRRISLITSSTRDHTTPHISYEYLVHDLAKLVFKFWQILESIKYCMNSTVRVGRWAWNTLYNVHTVQ